MVVKLVICVFLLNTVDSPAELPPIEILNLNPIGYKIESQLDMNVLL